MTTTVQARPSVLPDLAVATRLVEHIGADHVSQVAVQGCGATRQISLHFTPQNHGNVVAARLGLTPKFSYDDFQTFAGQFEGVPLVVFAEPDRFVVVDTDTHEVMTRPTTRKDADSIAAATHLRRVHVEQVTR